MVFITIDTLGGVFSVLSLVFRSEFDVLAGVAYGLVVVSICPLRRFSYECTCTEKIQRRSDLCAYRS